MGEDRFRLDARHRLAGPHDVGDARQQPPPQRAAGVRPGEVVGGEAAGIEQRHGQRVTERQRCGRARRRCQVQGAGLAPRAGVEVDVGQLRQRRPAVAGHCDQPRALALDQRHDRQQFLGPSGVRKRDEYVVASDHAEVAMARLGRVDEERRRPGRGQGRGDLAGDVPRLAHAADHHAAGALEDQPAGADERLVRCGASSLIASASIRSTRNAVSSRRSLCSIFVIPVCSISLPDPPHPRYPGRTDIGAGAPRRRRAYRKVRSRRRPRRSDAAGRRSARQSGWIGIPVGPAFRFGDRAVSGSGPGFSGSIPVQDFPVRSGSV